MIHAAFSVLVVLAALGSGVMAGFFFAFSAVIMAALARLPAAHGIAAMQSINVVVINVWFGAAFFGTGVICLLLAIFSPVVWSRPGTGYALAGSVLYLGGTMLVTIAFNVPRNEALATLAPASPDGPRFWTAYVAGWTAWNHVRTVAAFAALASFVMALRR